MLNFIASGASQIKLAVNRSWRAVYILSLTFYLVVYVILSYIEDSYIQAIYAQLIPLVRLFVL